MQICAAASINERKRVQQVEERARKGEQKKVVQRGGWDTADKYLESFSLLARLNQALRVQQTHTHTLVLSCPLTPLSSVLSHPSL